MQKPPDPSTPRRLTAAAILIPTLLSLAACRQQEAAGVPVAELPGKVVTDEPFLVLPNRAWRRHSQRESWFFARSASMITHVLEPLEEALIFGFIPEDTENPPCLETSWNGEEGTYEARPTEDGEIQVRIPASRLPRGTHYLNLRLCGGGQEAAIFSYIGFRYPGHSRVLPAREQASYSYLGDLLSFGVSGSFGREKLGGMVFDGPRDQRVRLPSEGGGLFTARVQNSTHAQARFTVRAGTQVRSLEVPAHGRERLELAIAAGTKIMTLSTEGAEGYYLWGASHFDPVGAPSRTPVVLITLDTTRKDALGAYGAPAGSTPNLDALAATATVYERAYTTAPWTLPSHASIFTGLYPSRHGAGVVADHLESRFETLAERLRAAGYLTAGFSGGTLSSYRFGMGQGFDLFRDPEGFESRGDLLTDHVLEFLEAHTDRSIFLFANYFDPHFPYGAPGGDASRAAVADPVWKAALEGDSRAWFEVVSGRAAADPAGREALVRAYRAEVAFMDSQLGRVLEAMRASDLFHRSLLIVTADHGELLGEGGFYSHSARLDPELMAVPLLVKWPRQQQTRRVDELVSLVDLFPTVLAAAGLEIPPQDGLSLGPGGRGALDARQRVLMEEHDMDFHRLVEHMKLGDHLYGAQEAAFRHLSWEEGEACYRASEELAGSRWRPEPCPDGPSPFATLQSEAWRVQEERIGLTDEERAHLKALGYLQ